VNDKVARKVDHAGVQIPAPQVMLTKTWYLNPPNDRQTSWLQWEISTKIMWLSENTLVWSDKCFICSMVSFIFEVTIKTNELLYFTFYILGHPSSINM